MDSNKSIFIDKIKKNMQKYREILLKTIISIQKYKILDLFSVNETYGCINSLENINSKINILLNSNLKQDYGLVEETITSELCNVLKTYGTENMNDLLYVCFPNLTFEKYIEF